MCVASPANGEKEKVGTRRQLGVSTKSLGHAQSYFSHYCQEKECVETYFNIVYAIYVQRTAYTVQSNSYTFIVHTLGSMIIITSEWVKIGQQNSSKNYVSSAHCSMPIQKAESGN